MQSRTYSYIRFNFRYGDFSIAMAPTESTDAYHYDSPWRHLSVLWPICKRHIWIRAGYTRRRLLLRAECGAPAFHDGSSGPWNLRALPELNAQVIQWNVVARDGIEPPTPAFSGLPDNAAKWLGISGYL
jgi:hypothetical protein